MYEDNTEKEIYTLCLSVGLQVGTMAMTYTFTLTRTHKRADGNIAKLLGRYVRDRGVISLQEAIRKLTALPAGNLGIADRGHLVPGYYADIAVFDAATIMDHATYEDPHQYATGMVHVFVNGGHVLRAGEHTGALPGQVVRGPGWNGQRASLQ